MWGILFGTYGSSVFSSVFAITERSEMGLYVLPVFMVGFWNWFDVCWFPCVMDDVVV